MLAYQKRTQWTMLGKDYGGKSIWQTHYYLVVPDVEADADGVRYSVR